MPTIIYDYPNVADVNEWTTYLGRKLIDEEIAIINDVITENKFNKRIKSIHQFAQTMNLYVPTLTHLHGNCIFECLQYFGLCHNITTFRQAIAFLLLTYKNQKYFFPNQELTLNELFTCRNEIPYVFCKKTNKYYIYNYDTMCIDLGTPCAWTRMDTQSILTVISIICNLKIIILHDNLHITEICTEYNEYTETIYVGLIKEVHYIPLDHIKPGTKPKCPRYTNDTKTFVIWAKLMAEATGHITHKPSKPSKRKNNKK